MIQAPDHLVEKYKQRDGIENPGYAAMIEGMDKAVGRVLEDPPGEQPVILCYKLNGEYLSPKAGAPVRMIFCSSRSTGKS